MSNEIVELLSLQPYYGGSHRQFMDEWMQHSKFKWDLMSLPDRHWKWRMRHSAIHFANLIDRTWQASKWQAILCTDMLNVAEFKGLLKTNAGNLPLVLYFHENQFAYPDRQNLKRDMHFAFSNFTSALAADEVWFNSEFNLKSMLQQLEMWCDIWPDYQPKNGIRCIERKSKIMPPGVCFSHSPNRFETGDGPVRILWAARWEHDKNPNELLQILKLIEGEVEFEISIIGEQYNQSPAEFDEIKRLFTHRIINWGYQSKSDYHAILDSSDVILSTASHEFFGISVVEAMAAGCMPLLPNRLSYPELLSVSSSAQRRKFLYETPADAAEKLIEFSKSIKTIDLENQMIAEEIRSRFNWHTCACRLDNGIEALLSLNDDADLNVERDISNS